MYKLIRETEWYFFSPRNQKHPNGFCLDQTAGEGFWKATGKELEIKVVDKIIGYQNSLDYYEGKNPNDRTDWKLHELRMTNDIAPPIKIGVQGMKVLMYGSVLYRFLILSIFSKSFFFAAERLGAL